jgi:outer membrane immunogenic protein
LLRPGLKVLSWELQGVEMKALLLSATAAAALAMGPALAADMPLKAPGMAPVVSWSNCHIGGFAGLKHTDDTTLFFGPPVVVPPVAGTDRFNATGAYAGGTVGCDYQFSSPFVIGVEADAGWSNLHRHTLDILNPAFHFVVDESALATVRGRLGYLVGPGLLYVTGGGAWSRLKNSEFRVGGEFESVSLTKSGWTVGGGYEAMFAPNWSLKLEYLFVDLGTASFPFIANGGITGTNHLLEVREHVVKLGVNYRINWGRY